MNYILLKERAVIPALLQVDAKFSTQPAGSVFTLGLNREDGGKMSHRNDTTHLRHYTAHLHVFSYTNWPLNLSLNTHWMWTPEEPVTGM